MGAINFGTLTNKSRFALVNIVETDEEDENDYNNYYYDDYEETQQEIEKYNFYYFNLLIDYGYYEGFYLRLAENNTKWIYDNSQEKAEVLKELTTIKNILIELIENGLLRGAYPGWGTAYTDKKTTIKELKAIIKELKEEVKASYTQATAKRQNKSIFEIIKEAEAR